MDEPDQLQASLDDLYKAGFKAGREAGMREAAEVCKARSYGGPESMMAEAQLCAAYILSAIEGAK